MPQRKLIALNDAERQGFARQAANGDMAGAVRSSGRKESTIKGWIARYKVVSNIRSAPSAVDCATPSTAGVAEPTPEYDGIPGALPPDKNTVGYWRTKEFVQSADYAECVVFGPLQLPDGRHAAGFAMSNYQSPRDGTADSGAGVFALLGVPGDAAGDKPEYLQSENRPDWWLHGPKMDSAELEGSVDWMLRTMRGDIDEAATDDEILETLNYATFPTLRAMQDAAETYQARTGDYAFPVYVSRQHHEHHYHQEDMQLAIVNKGESPHLQFGIPAGFAIFDAKEAAAQYGDQITWEKAYDSMSYAVNVYNDVAGGAYIEGTVGVFGSDADVPGEVIGTGYTRSEQLPDEIKSVFREHFMAEPQA